MKPSFRQGDFRVDEENPYWISFSDLMSGLLVIFILMSVALIIELTEKSNIINAELYDAEKARKNIVSEIIEKLKKEGIEIEHNKNKTILHIPESTLTFSPGSDKLPVSRDLRDKIRTIGIVIRNALNRPYDKKDKNKLRYEYLDTVFVEGHTDHLRLNTVKGNWGLSAYRAISVWQFWTKKSDCVKGAKRRKCSNIVDNGSSLADMKNSKDEKLFSVSGYGSTRPREKNAVTADQRRKNRRISIRFTIKHPSLSKLGNL